MGSGNSSETPKKARVPDEDEEVLNLSEDEVLVLCLPFRLFIYVCVCAHPPTQNFDVVLDQRLTNCLTLSRTFVVPKTIQSHGPRCNFISYGVAW